LNAAPNNTSTGLTVSKANQTISFASGSSVTKNYGDAAFGDTATATSGGTVTYSSDNTAVATVNSSGTVTIVAAGSANILANCAATPNYNAAPQTSQALTVNKATPTVTVTVGTYTYTGSSQGPSTFTTSPIGDTGTPTWTYRGTGFTTSPSGDTGAATWSYVGVSGTTYGPSATRPTLAGSYTAQVTAVTPDANFNSSSSSATAFSIG
jgi:hypothetical protein